MLIGSIIVALVGVLCVVIGWLIWKKEKLTLLHDYHYQYVEEKNKKAFCRAMGMGLLILGIGLLTTAFLLVLTDSAWSFLSLIIGFGIGFVLLIYAGIRYNRRPKQ